MWDGVAEPVWVTGDDTQGEKPASAVLLTGQAQSGALGKADCPSCSSTS